MHEFISNYKRAARINGCNPTNLSLGLPFYLKGHASAWFKTLETADEMSFDQLADALVPRSVLHQALVSGVYGNL